MRTVTPLVQDFLNQYAQPLALAYTSFKRSAGAGSRDSA